MPINSEQLLVLVSLAVFALAATALSALVTVGHPWIHKRIAHRHPRQRARAWMAVRLLPSTMGLVVSGGFALAFIRFEPRHATEQAGAVLFGLAALTIVLLSSAGWRVGRAIWKTGECHRLVERIGERRDLPGLSLTVWRVPIDFPLAAVSGVLRPRLLVSSRLLEEFGPDELAIVLRHEAAHAGHRDNLVRLGLLACPDVLGLTGSRNDLTAAWHQAVEEAADEEAAGNDPAARAALASALVRVGRMSADGQPPWMPALALYDGHPLESRVRGLLAAGRTSCPPNPLALKIAGGLMGATATWIATGPRLLHACVEWSVRNLP